MKKDKSYPRGYKHLLWNFEALIRNLCLKHSVLDFKTENILTMWTKWPCLCECQWCNMIQPKLSNKWQRTVLNFQSHDKLAFHSNNRFPSKGSPFSHLICKCKSSNSIFAMFCTYRLITTICDKLKCLNRHRSNSDVAVLLPKWSPYEYIILTEEEAGHSYTFWYMPI